MAWLARRAKTLTVLTATLLFFLLTLHANSSLALADAQATLKSLTLKTYLDGYVQVIHEMEVDDSYPSVNVTLLGEPQSLLIIDEQGLPLDFSIANSLTVVDSLGCSWIQASYFTQDLTSKTGKYWTLQTNVPINITIILPSEASIISLNEVPDLIESSEDQVTLVMPAGQVEISYIAERSFIDEPASDAATWLLLLALSLPLVLAVASAVWFFSRGKTSKPETVETGRVDVEKLFEREKDLRQEEIQVIRFLAEKNGSAFEAEVYEMLALPRTTTWRLLKRLEKMEIVEIRKTRRQNIVSVRKKYLKKPDKQAF